jgi:hypothetical protein
MSYVHGRLNTIQFVSLLADHRAVLLKKRQVPSCQGGKETGGEREDNSDPSLGWVLSTEENNGGDASENRSNHESDKVGHDKGNRATEDSNGHGKIYHSVRIYRLKDSSVSKDRYEKRPTKDAGHEGTGPCCNILVLDSKDKSSRGKGQMQNVKEKYGNFESLG